MRLSKNGQSVTESALLIAVCIAALIAAQLYVKRGIMGKLKEAADATGRQFTPYNISGNESYSWGVRSSGESQSSEKRVVSGGQSGLTNTTFSGNETRDEFETFGDAPVQVY